MSQQQGRSPQKRIKGTPRAPRATHRERDTRISLVRKLISARMTNGEIKRAMATQFGLSPRTAEGYISRARAEIMEDLGRSREDHQADAYTFYCAVVGNREASNRDKIKAQERIDKLLGLESPAKISQELTGPGGEPLTIRAGLMHQMMQDAERRGGFGPEIVDESLPVPAIESMDESAVVAADVGAGGRDGEGESDEFRTSGDESDADAEDEDDIEDEDE